MRSSDHSYQGNLVTPVIIILRLQKEIIKLKEEIKKLKMIDEQR